MRSRYGEEVVHSARGNGSSLHGSGKMIANGSGSPKNGDGGGGAGSAASSSGAATPGNGIDLSSRRLACIKRAFKRLDPTGSGRVPLDEVLLTLAAAPSLTSAAQQELRSELTKVSVKGADTKTVLHFAAFAAYYQNVSAGIYRDSEFEQLLQTQWGYLQVSEILASMQRQFTLFGMCFAFQDLHQHNGEITLQEFETCMKRIGLLPRPDELQRVYGAFVSVGAKGGLRIDDFKEQLLAPRPETPVPSTARGRRILPPAVPTSVTVSAAAAAARAAAACAKPMSAAPAPPISPVAGSSVFPPLGIGPPTSGACGSTVGSCGSAVSPGMALPSSGVSVGNCGSAVPPGPGSPQKGEDFDDELEKMQRDLARLRKTKAANGPSHGTTQSLTGSTGLPTLHEVEGQVSDADLDAALANLEARLDRIKAHNKADHQPSVPIPVPVVDMPKWEHHKYGHHKITEPAWKPPEKVVDFEGHKHNATEYQFNVYGAGSHGHHVPHYHVGDYGTLDHHSYKPQEYKKAQYGDPGQHGHWVPHLHGIGT